MPQIGSIAVGGAAFAGVAGSPDSWAAYSSLHASRQNQIVSPSCSRCGVLSAIVTVMPQIGSTAKVGAGSALGERSGAEYVSP